MIFKIDWGTWAALITVMSFVLVIFKLILQIYFPGRDEFEKLEQTVNLVAQLAHDSKRKTDSIYRERKEFREEVLDRLNSMSERIDDLVRR